MLVEFIVGVVGQLAALIPGSKILSAMDRRALQADLTAAVRRAEDAFVQEYSHQDRELVEVLKAQIELASEPGLQGAMRDILLRPFHDPSESTYTINQSFSDVLPSFTERGRVESAVSYFLNCLGREVLYIDQLSPRYSLLLQKKSLEGTTSIATNTAQIVEVMRGLRSDLLQLSQSSAHTPLELSEGLSQPVGPARPKHNLPQRPYFEFVGRREELDDSIRLMLPHPRGRHFLVTIDGVGGVGKSALALELGYHYLDKHEELPSEERFDAIVWVSAKQVLLTASGLQPRYQSFGTLGDLYRELATEMELPEILRVDKQEQSALIRTGLTNKRVLLIIDNLETIDDKELISFLLELPDPTKAIVTTRHRIDGAYAKRLEGMPSEDATDLIKMQAADNNVILPSGMVESLYERTGGVPLGIVWSVGLMGLGYEPNSVLEKLSSGQSDIARFCFSESVARIRDHASYLLLLALSLFESNVNRLMLGTVAGVVNDIQRDDGLAELMQISFVNKEGDRFSLLPLTQVFAFEELRLHPDHESVMRERWVQALMNLAGPFAEVNWRWHDLRDLSFEGTHLITLVNWSKETSRPDLMLPALPALGFYYDLTGQWTERLSVEELGVQTARLLGDKKIHFICLRDICGVLAQQGHYERAESVIRDALNLAREESQVTWQCKALISLAGVKRRQDKFDEAVNYCQQAASLTFDMNENLRRQILASIQYELGKIERDREDWKAAEKHFLAARDVFGFSSNSADFDVGRAWGVLSNLGVVAHKLGDLDAAEKIYLQCLDYCRRTGSKGSVATLLVRLAEVEEQRGNVLLALRSAEEALAWSTHLNLVEEKAIAEAVLARLSQHVPIDRN